MGRKIVLIGVGLFLMSMPLPGRADRDDVAKSSNWSRMVHEENSVIASVLYIPYIFLQLPFRIIDGIFNPKPASRATVPPPAHRADE